MAKQAISVTLAPENLGWLRARAQASGRRSISQVLDEVVLEARTTGRGGPARSAVGLLTIDAADPELREADEAIRGMFHASVSKTSPERPRRATRRAPRRG